MRKTWVGAIALLAALRLPGSAQTASNWVLAWSDEFNRPANTSPDPQIWTYDLGNGGPQNPGWGNAELQSYQSDTSNVSHDGNGNLVIRALKVNNSYTSARIKTLALREFTFGKIEARIKIPYAQGIWPAFWMLGANNATAGWPECGEIDIMENFGRRNNDASRSHATIHGPGYSGGDSITAVYQLPDGAQIADDFHVYAVEWTKDRIEFFVDGSSFQKITAPLSNGKRWVFNDHPFYIILNVAVGGSPAPVGNPDASTTFPQQMLIDYVRVYRKLEEVGAPSGLKITVQ